MVHIQFDGEKKKRLEKVVLTGISKKKNREI